MRWSGRAAPAQVLLLLGGCGGDARVEFSAADAIQQVAGQMAGTIEEYHGDVSRADMSRESAVVAAFVGRVKQDAGDETKLATHVSDFEQALTRIRSDRETEWSRRTTALDNVAVLREIGQGLQKLAIESLGLQDEVKRYLESWVTQKKKEPPMHADEDKKRQMNADERG